MKLFKCTCRSTIYQASLKHATSISVMERSKTKGDSRRWPLPDYSKKIDDLRAIGTGFKTIVRTEGQEREWHAITDDGAVWRWCSKPLEVLRADARASREQRALKKISEKAHPTGESDKPVHAKSL